MRQETPAVVAGNEAIRPSGGCASSAFCAARNYGAGRSDPIGSRPRFRRMRNANSRTASTKRGRSRPSAGRMYMSCRGLHDGPSESANDKALPALVFHRRAQGRRGGARGAGPGFRPNINRFYIWPARRPCRTRPSCKRSASWFCLAHGAENLPVCSGGAADSKGAPGLSVAG
jgi:hypothetical protein